MLFVTAADVAIQITSENTASERRVSPIWTISHFKGRLEPITGIPSSSQRLTLRQPGQPKPGVPIAAANEDTTKLEDWPLTPYAEIYVHDTRPPGQRTTYTDVSTVPKYEMSPQTYASLPTNTVLAYKRAHNIGRFDPNAPTLLQQHVQHAEREIAERGIVVGRRCRLLPDPSLPGPPQEDDRRGVVAYVGAVPELPGPVPEERKWVGVRLDEPTGRNDGRVGVGGKAGGGGGGEGGKRYFDGGQGGMKYGVFVRPERLEVGDFEVLDELGDEFEEI